MRGVGIWLRPDSILVHSGSFWRLEPERQMAEGEKLVAEFPSVRHKKQDGVLLLTSARVAWSAGELLQVNYPYHQIKG